MSNLQAGREAQMPVTDAVGATSSSQPDQPDNVAMQAIRNLIRTLPPESKTHDYKGPMTWSRDADRSARCEIVKDIIAFANTHGGRLIIGVVEEDGHHVLRGMTKEEIKSFESTRVAQFVQSYVDPPISCRTYPVECDGLWFVVIEVSEFADVPHIVKKTYPSVLDQRLLYIRTDSSESAAISTSADLRALTERAIRKRQDYMLTAIRAIMSSGSGQTEDESTLIRSRISRLRQELTKENPYGYAAGAGFLEIYFFPPLFRRELSLANLRSRAAATMIDHKGWPFLYYNDRDANALQDSIRITVDHKFFGNRQAYEVWDLSQDGVFFKSGLLREDGRDDTRQQRILWWQTFALDIAEALECLTLFYEDLLEPTDEVVFGLRLLGVDGRTLSSGTRGFDELMAFGFKCRIPEITFEAQRPLADWRAGLLDYAVQVLEHVSHRFNWQHPPLQSARAKMEDNLRTRM